MPECVSLGSLGGISSTFYDLYRKNPPELLGETHPRSQINEYIIITSNMPLLKGNITPDQTLSSHLEWTVSLVIVDGHLNLPQASSVYA